MPIHQITAVVFDAVGTLIRPEPPAPEVYAAVGRRHGSRLSVAEVASRFQAAFLSEEAVDRERHGLRTSEARERERWQAIVRNVLADAADTAACFDELYAHFAKPLAWRCLPDVAESLDFLGNCRLVAGVASNYDHRLHSVLAGTPALRGLEHVVISSEVGWRKPASQFFTALCQRLGLPAANVLLVGDDLANDYEGALAAGLQAVLLDPMCRRPGTRRIDRLGDLPGLLEQAQCQR